MGGRRFTHDEVVEYFKEHECELLTDSYTGSTQRLDYRCSCGNVSVTEFRNFKSGKRCKRCGTKKMIETHKKHYGGVVYFQTPEFLKKRRKKSLERYGVESPLQNAEVLRKREKTNLSRYGVPHVSQVPEIAARQKKGFVDKYGVSHFMYNPESKAKFKKTLMDRYGVPSLAYLSRCASAESQELFVSVCNLLPCVLSERCYFASRNHEFVVRYNGNFFKYDFVQSRLKICIEYNGRRFHPSPEQDDSETGWCVFHSEKTVREARDYECLKYEALKVKGFEFLTVWDDEYRSNKTKIVKKCVDFLTKGK